MKKDKKASLRMTHYIHNP